MRHIDKTARESGNAHRNTDQGCKENRPQNRAGDFSCLQGNGQKQPAERNQRPRRKEIPEHQGVGFGVSQHQSGVTEAQYRDEQPNGRRQTELDRLRHRTGYYFTQAEFGQQEKQNPRPAGDTKPDLPANAFAARQRDADQHRTADARPDDKRQVGIKRHQQRAADEHQNRAGGCRAFIHPAHRQQAGDNHQ